MEKNMEALAINEIRQRKKSSEEIPPGEGETETLRNAETEKEIPPGEREKETPPGAKRDEETPPSGHEKETSPDAKREKDTPPSDDICPICFGNYNIPCKTNCGHWFCANCVVSFWAYGNKLTHCKCPICSQSISKLTPEASLNLRTEDKEVVEALKKVQGYNRLFKGGVHGLILRLRRLPLLSKRFYQQIPCPRCLWRMFYIGLNNPNNLLLNYVIARAVAFNDPVNVDRFSLLQLILTLLYDCLDLHFLPGGFTVGLVLVLAAIGLYRRIVANRRPPRRRRPRPDPISGPKNPPVQGSGLPQIQDEGPPVSGPKNPSVQGSGPPPIQDEGPPVSGQKNPPVQGSGPPPIQDEGPPVSGP
ncbi:hypothetical protein RHMOL_Rhmol09G0015500 [Rhododendron molle]|uniref:Uncharacterized protein n=1 Tax=Rhododendron molle TaxID=49168 RepID=A0ACC0M8Z7_RHOML|nr:hypothetical protein RHMOL_Rhmol09G0015500 [Rhododendron molle]